MMQVARSWLLLAAVTIGAALFSFATPALAHSAHHVSPIANAAYTTKSNAHDVGRPQSKVVDVTSQLHQDDAKRDTATCCGLSCMVAVPQYNPQLLLIALHHSSILPPLQPELLGSDPARLDRPPTA